jgi:uncharacterized phage protein gp47/JayE
MPDDYGVKPTGFVRKPLDAILADVEARQRGLLGDDWETESDTVTGQFNGIYAEELALAWEVVEAVYNAGARGSAEDVSLDNVGALTGSLRQKARFSKALVSLTLAEGTTVAASKDAPAIISVQGRPDARFLITSDVVAPEHGGIVTGVVAIAERAGPTLAGAGLLTVIETPVLGWTAVTNPQSAEVGAPIETDPQYRLRQVQELGAAGGGTVDGIRGDLMRITGVTAAQVLENTDSIVQDGMPPHSVEAVVLGGDATAIAQSLLSNVVAAVPTHGSEPPVLLVDSQGVERAIRFSRPTERPIYVAIFIEAGDDYDVTHAALREAIAAAAVTLADDGYLDVGTDVYAGRITCTAIEVPGVTNVISVGLSFSSIAAPEDGAPKLSIGSREIATVDSADIEVVVV